MQQELGIKEVDTYEQFPPDEGSIQLVYGRIGSGKTYTLTRLILEDLARGQVVYCNWKVNFEGFDERNSILELVLGVLGLKSWYVNVDKRNFHYVDIREFQGKDFTEWLSTLTDCVVYLDEAQTVLNSYEMTSISRGKQSAISFTRHFNRRIVVASQRWQNVHVQARANVNFFTKCERIFKLGRLVLFKMSTFEDLDSLSAVDETNASEVRYMWGSKKVFEAYNTKYLRGDTPISQQNYAELIWLAYYQRLERLKGILRSITTKKTGT